MTLASILIYGITLGLSVFFAYLGKFTFKEKSLIRNVFFFISIGIVIGVSGFRNLTVGTDNKGYAEWYYSIDTELSLSDNIISNLDYEPGYIILNLILLNSNLGYTIAALLYATIIWFFIYKSHYRHKDIFYLTIFCLITGGFLFFTFNGIRQAIAVSIVFFASTFLVDKKYIKFILAILSASLFHLSAILLLPLLFINSLGKVKPYIWLVLLILSVLLPASFFYAATGKVASIIPSYVDYFLKLDSFNNTGYTIGSIYQIILGFVLLFYYSKVANTKMEVMVFNLSLIGAILYNLFFESAIIGRFYVYFLFFQNYAFAFLFYYLLKKKRIIEVSSLMVIFLLVFIYRIIVNESGCSPYYFGLYW